MYASLNLAHSRDCYEVLQTPYMICDTSRHRWSDPERTVNATEVVVRKVQRDGRLQAAELLGEGQCQPVQPLQGEPYSQIVPFHVAGADSTCRRLYNSLQRRLGDAAER